MVTTNEYMGVGNGGSGGAFVLPVFQPTIYELPLCWELSLLSTVLAHSSVDLVALVLDLDIEYCTLISVWYWKSGRVPPNFLAHYVHLIY